VPVYPRNLNQYNNGYGYKEAQHYWGVCRSALSEISGYYDNGGYDHVIERGTSFIAAQINSISDLPKMTEADLGVLYLMGNAYLRRGQIDKAIGCFHIVISQHFFGNAMLTSPDGKQYVQNAGNALEEIAKEVGEERVNNFQVEQFVSMEFKKSGPCFVATAAYGSYFSPEVILLRRFRDRVLLNSVPGRVFVKFYYLMSPPLASVISNVGLLRAMTRCIFIAPILRLLKAAKV